MDYLGNIIHEKVIIVYLSVITVWILVYFGFLYLQFYRYVPSVNIKWKSYVSFMLQFYEVTSLKIKLWQVNI